MRLLMIVTGALALAGCETPVDTARRADDRAVDALNEAGRLKDKVAELETEVANLKSDLESSDRYLKAVAASLDEARGNHTALRKTFNDNVDIGNRRDKAQEQDINWWRLSP